ncbi:monooxygenase, FAD-binding [Francisella sp. W12-1067]|nr:monooxygenase, FAD-binding [Francisella sp. W12-1067]
MKVLIVGAGPTGLTLAVELAYRGIDIRIVEKRKNASNLSRAIGIQPATLRRYAHLGDITQKILSEGIHISQVNIFRHNTLLASIDLKKYLADDELMISLPQDRTEAIIEQKLKELGREVEYGVELKSLYQNVDATVTAEFSNAEDETFDYVVGADGAHSKVRELAGIEQQGYVLPDTWYIADFYAKSENIDAATVSNTKAGLFFMMRMADKRYRIVSNHEIDLKKLPYNLEVDNVYRQGSFKISIKQAKQYFKGHIILCGDAAHTHSPVGGRGMNLGIADAFAAAKAIVTGNLAAYNDKQHAKGKEIINMTERGRKFIMSQSQGNAWLLRLILLILSKTPWLQRKFAKTIVTF